MVGYWTGIRIVEKRHCWDHIFTAMENPISRTGFIANGLFLHNVGSTKSYILRCAESIYWDVPDSCQMTVLLISSSGECINPVPVRYYHRPNTTQHILMRCVCFVASVMWHRYINLPRKPADLSVLQYWHHIWDLRSGSRPHNWQDNILWDQAQ